MNRNFVCINFHISRKTKLKKEKKKSLCTHFVLFIKMNNIYSMSLHKENDANSLGKVKKHIKK